MTGSHQPRRPVHRRPEIVAAAFVCGPSVDTHPHSDADRLRPHLGGQGCLSSVAASSASGQSRTRRKTRHPLFRTRSRVAP